MRTYKRKRLRKKYETGEFAIKGFNVTIRITPPISRSQSDIVWDELIEFVEKNDFSVCGQTRPDLIEWAFCKGRSGRRMRNGHIRWHQDVPATEADRECVRTGIEAIWSKLKFASTIDIDVGNITVVF